METLEGIIRKTHEDYGHAVRSVHAKSHALVEGELRVEDGLPPALAQGLFARPGRYPVLMRFSTNPGDLLPDSISVPRGLAIKVIGVEGERLPGSEGDTTQDFVMATGEAFAAPTPGAFLKNLKLLAKTTDRAEGAKVALSAVLRVTEKALETVGGESTLLKTMGGYPQTHPLGEHYFTQVPLRYGDHVAKLSVTPASPALRALREREIDIAGRENALREEVLAFFGNQGGEWLISAQLATDVEKTPIEDASVVWPRDDSPYVPVARLVVPPQTAWSPERVAAVDDRMAFSPWHGLAAHRPLGGVMRARKPTYEASAGLRGRLNGCPIHEPRRDVRLPG